MSNTKMTTVKDTDVISTWISSNDSTHTAEITPDWYAENGTPIDDEGYDMMYVCTEVRTPSISKEELISVISGNYLTEQLTVTEQLENDTMSVVNDRITEEYEDLRAEDVMDKIISDVDALISFLTLKNITVQ